MPAPTAGPGTPEDVLDLIEDGADLIVPLANGEPVTVLDALEAGASRFQGVRVHQMHALHDRPYLHGSMRQHLLHVSYFLSEVTRPAFHARGCELMPNHFSEVPRLLLERHSPVDERIPDLATERIPNGATIQAGIGSIPSALLAGLRDHRDLGIHTELFSDPSGTQWTRHGRRPNSFRLRRSERCAVLSGGAVHASPAWSHPS